MAATPVFTPPGGLEDFDSIPGQLQQWSDAVSGWLSDNIELARQRQYPHQLQPSHPEPSSSQPSSEAAPFPFYNQASTTPPTPFIDQPIVWNGFPSTLRNRWPRPIALDAADQLFPLTVRMDGPGRYFVGSVWDRHFYRPQDEYCEWRVTRDTEGRIVRVTFTSEPPEFWQALHGDELQNMDGARAYPFTGDKKLMLELYREMVSPEVQLADLECPEDMVDYTIRDKPAVVYRRGEYNPYNRWNTLGGIVHLTHPANSLSAEINLGAAAAVLYQQDGRPIVDPDGLICAARFGGLNRASDPTIGSAVNELAALGAYVTLRDPIGLAMHHLNMTGLMGPDGQPVDASCFQVLRGKPEEFLIERAVFEVPASEGYTVSDITIGGVPITHGGQLAERMVVNIVGRASGLHSFDIKPTDGQSLGCQDDLQPNYLFYRDSAEQRCAPIAREAFAYPPATPATPATVTTSPGESSVRSAAHSAPEHSRGRGGHRRFGRAL
jgi:hypothetical protein